MSRRRSVISLVPDGKLFSRNSTPEGVLAPSTRSSNRISKRRTSTVSIDTLDHHISNSRRNSYSSISESPCSSASQDHQRHSLSSLFNLGCNTSTSPLAATFVHNVASFDMQRMYKRRIDHSARKLLRFFGHEPPLDVCVKEIEREGLKAMLMSKIPLCYFLRCLLQEYSSENLFFFLEAEQYEAFSYTSLSHQLTAARHIYSIYLDRSSHFFEVNVDEEVRKTISDTLSACEAAISSSSSPSIARDLSTIFEPAKRAVFNLLETSYAKFAMGEIYSQMVREIGHSTSYSVEARARAVRFLLGYLEQEWTTICARGNPHTRRHLHVLEAMVREFCHMLLKVDYEEYDALASPPQSPKLRSGLFSAPETSRPMSSSSSSEESTGAASAGSIKHRLGIWGKRQSLRSSIVWRRSVGLASQRK
ncbi:uncharacterized protein VTP21DRAFT_6696 [Calcarisporiella thermophila]|uniref:uncharacterized protein n=1 Tax=Calcarisporiella thermophila TaxID=911321 RepID=UPI00374444E8